MEEIWKDIPNYEGMYQVSNLGNVKSLSRIFLKKGKYNSYLKEKILKSRIDGSGYLAVALYKNSKRKDFCIHQLIAHVFLNHKSDGTHRLVVDHINNVKLDNRLENIQIITARENTSKDKKNKTSKYVGVCWNKQVGKWHSRINIYGKNTHLGYFTCEIEASKIYQKALNKIL